MAVHDGPGLRTTVFLKGCPLRCKWCHNPEGLVKKQQLMYKQQRCVGCMSCYAPCDHADCKPFGRCIHRCPENCLEIVGREISAENLARELKMGAEVLGEDFGGVTFSGGEPLMQPEFLLAVADQLEGIHLCIETSGYAPNEVFAQIIARMSFVIMDIKLADPALHKQYTGVDNGIILQNFSLLQKSGKPYLIRTPLIPGITDTVENLEKIQNLIGESTWEKLPYNGAAGAKYKMLNMEYSL